MNQPTANTIQSPTTGQPIQPQLQPQPQPQSQPSQLTEPEKFAKCVENVFELFRKVQESTLQLGSSIVFQESEVQKTNLPENIENFQQRVDYLYFISNDLKKVYSDYLNEMKKSKEVQETLQVAKNQQIQKESLEKLREVLL